MDKSTKACVGRVTGLLPPILILLTSCPRIGATHKIMGTVLLLFQEVFGGSVFVPVDDKPYLCVAQRAK